MNLPKEPDKEFDKELNDDELDLVVGGVKPVWPLGHHPNQGGTHYHGKKDQTSGMDDMTDANGAISF